MSRTHKDRPYWVRVNDFTLEMEYRHDHTVFGKIERWPNPDVNLIYRYMNYCTAFDRNVRPESPLASIYGKDIDGVHERWEYPCIRFEIRRKNNKWFYGFRYSKSVVRPKERDFLRSQVRRYNSNYHLQDDTDFMNEDVFTTRAGDNGKKC